jgi:hypothetical protein
VVENVFRETHAYSDRVVGLGLWQTRVLPWIELPSNDWFGSDPEDRSKASDRRPRGRGLLINDRTVSLSIDEAERLITITDAAIANGELTVNFTSNGETFAISATAETLPAQSQARARITAANRR